MGLCSIWKYPLEVTNRQEVLMPKGAVILSVHVQDGSPCIWAIVNPRQGASTAAPRVIRMYGTGHHFDVESFAFIGTFLVASGTLVFHVFEELER